MTRQYSRQNVYDALRERLKYLFDEFDNIYVSFSGGKDSGLLLNLVLDFQQKNYPNKTIGVFHQDFEAQYTVTTEYIERTFERIHDKVEPYWVCLPMATRTALSSYEMFWYPWDDTKQDSWIRKMPEKDYVINLSHNPISTYKYKMHQEDLAKQFGRWVCAQKNPCSGTVAFSTKNTDMRANAGSAASLRMSGVPPPYMTGPYQIYGMQIICLGMIITTCTTYIIWQVLRCLRCGSHRRLTTIPRIP